MSELVFKELATAQTTRNKERLDIIMQIRIDNPHLRVIGEKDTAKRMELCFRYWSRTNPKIAPIIREILYNEPDFFQKASLTSTDTILRDSRELEILGFFEKE